MKLSSSFIFVTVASGLLLTGRVVDATYSVIATDRATGQVGLASTTCRFTCTDPSDFRLDFVPVAGKGVAAAQAQATAAQANTVAASLGAGKSPEDAVNDAIPGNMDQIAAVDMTDSFVETGPGVFQWAGSDNGQTKKDYVFSVQGNDLTSGNVVNQATLKFPLSLGCDLAERLMKALEAGSKGGEGDVDCPANVLSTNLAYLKVIDKDGNAVIDEFVEFFCVTTGQSAVEALKQKFKTWRKENKCPKRPKSKNRFLPKLPHPFCDLLPDWIC